MQLTQQAQYNVNYITLAVFFLVSIIFVPLVVFITKFLAPHNPGEEKNLIYECGVPARSGIFTHYYIRYYIFAFLFVLFDVEVVFLYPWAVLFRTLGIAGLVEVLIFVIVLILGLAYVWKKGILKWD
ncbi:MAG: NADH-quinone oxidoreductase subunit A [Actinobacteria bacterium]|nr:NADH-quinone oxidoreductase subunit A [Actinomycetota bacterium]